MTDGLSHDDFRLADLRVPEPALRACATAGLFRAREVADATAAPDGLAADAWAVVRERAAAFVGAPLPLVEVVDLDLGLDDLLCGVPDGRRTVRALASIGVDTAGRFLACPRAELLAARGIGVRSVERVLDALRERARASSAPDVVLEWLPEPLLATRLDTLRLPDDVLVRTAARGATTVRDLLTGRGPDDPQLRAAVRAALATATGAGPGTERAAQPSFSAVLNRFRSALDEVDQQLFDRLLGVGRRPCTLTRAAVALRLPLDAAAERERALRARLAATCGDLLGVLAVDARTALAIQEGAVGVDDLTLGTALHAATQQSPDAALPLRLLAFGHPDRWAFEADRLCGATASELRALVRVLRTALRTARPPVRVADLTADAGCATGLVVHALRRILGYSVVLRPDAGEVVTVRRTSVAARLEAILDDADAPIALDDLLFRYRDRHGRGSRRRILEALRGPGAFLELAPGQWSLQARHVDELELLRPEAERIAADAVRGGHRVSLRDRVRRGEISERCAFLLDALLRRTPELRPLGRGDFAVRGRPLSETVAAIVAELRRAMGEVPYSRFLQNQPPPRRRLVGRLLRTNRLFVSPAKDRVDLAENYPLAGDRLRMMLQEVRTCVEEAGGYAPLTAARRALDAAELGGAFLTDHLLLDILRRHGDFELLPGGVVASPGLALGRWIQRTARDILRSHVTALTWQQIVAERPELAEFADGLAELLEQDPLVQTADGLHYQLS